MKSRHVAVRAAAVGVLAAVALAGFMLIKSPPVRADEGNNDESKIQQGFAVAPVQLNLAGKDRALVGLGSYLVNVVGDCNGCHSAGPPSEFLVNPYLRSSHGSKQVNTATYLAGGRDFGPVATLTHLYSRNLTPDAAGRPEGGRSFSEFVQIMRTGADLDHIHPNCPSTGPPTFNCVSAPFDGSLLQVMRWPSFQDMTDRDLLAIYTYLGAIPCNPGPSGLDARLYEQNVCH